MIKKPYFITADGVTVKGNDRVFCIGITLTEGKCCVFSDWCKIAIRTVMESHIFSTRVAAQNYCNNKNQPSGGITGQRMSLDKIYYEPIVVKKVGRNAFIAGTNYWMDSSKGLKIEVNQFGRTEDSAKRTLIDFLNGTGEAILVNATR